MTEVLTVLRLHLLRTVYTVGVVGVLFGMSSAVRGNDKLAVAVSRLQLTPYLESFLLGLWFRFPGGRIISEALRKGRREFLTPPPESTFPVRIHLLNSRRGFPRSQEPMGVLELTDP